MPPGDRLPPESDASRDAGDTFSAFFWRFRAGGGDARRRTAGGGRAGGGAGPSAGFGGIDPNDLFAQMFSQMGAGGPAAALATDRLSFEASAGLAHEQAVTLRNVGSTSANSASFESNAVA